MKASPKAKKLSRNTISVRKSRISGFGVFADKKIKKGDLIEECYFIETRGGDVVLEDYYFELGRKYALFTGYGSIYNHSEEPNADFFINKRTRIARIKATKDIAKDQEIYINYGDEWFKSRPRKKMKKVSG